MAYSEEARRKAIDAYLAGASLEHAGAMVGATGTSVHNWLMREGVPRRGVGRQPPDGGTVAHAVSMYVAGHSSYAVGAAFGVSHVTVLSWVRASGRRPRSSVDNDRRAEVVRRRDSGQTFAEIGRAMGITQQGAYGLYTRATRRRNDE